jgi:hypothetical protein
MFTVEIKGGNELIAKFEGLSNGLGPKIVDAVTVITAELYDEIVNNALNGGVLKVKSGKLSSHIKTDISSTETTVTGRVYVSKDDVPYAGVQEDGQVLNHPGGTAYTIINGFPTFISNAVAADGNFPRTKAHPIPVPPRSYMKSSLVNMEPKIINDLNQVVKEAVE